MAGSRDHAPGLLDERKSRPARNRGQHRDCTGSCYCIGSCCRHACSWPGRRQLASWRVGGGDFCHLPCCCPGAWAEGSVVGKPSAVLGLSAAGRTEGYGQQGRGTRECVPVVMLQQRGVATESPLCRKELAWLYGKSRRHKPVVLLQKITIIGTFPKTGIPSHSSGIRGAGKGPWWPFCQNFLPQRV